jgi:hypothetical protein
MGVADRRLLRLHIAARMAVAHPDTGIEGLNGGLQLALKIGDMPGDVVQLHVAALAEPEQRFGVLRRALDFDHQPPGVGWPVWRVRRQGRHEKKVAFE